VRPFAAPHKRREVVIICRFDADAGHFKGGGIDEFAYTETAVTRAQELVTFITFNDSDKFYNAAGFNFDGERSSYDFELLALHELGHALGLPHDGSGKVPPLMAPSLDLNGAMGDVTRLRAVSASDHAAVAHLMHRRPVERIAGTYTCKLASADGKHSDLALTITVDEEIVITSDSGWRLAAPVELLLSWPIDFPAAEVRRTGAFDTFKLLIDPQDHLRVIAELSNVRERRLCTLDRTK